MVRRVSSSSLLSIIHLDGCVSLTVLFPVQPADPSFFFTWVLRAAQTTNTTLNVHPCDILAETAMTEEEGGGFFWPLHRALSTLVAQNVLFHPSVVVFALIFVI